MKKWYLFFGRIPKFIFTIGTFRENVTDWFQCVKACLFEFINKEAFYFICLTDIFQESNIVKVSIEFESKKMMSFLNKNDIKKAFYCGLYYLFFNIQIWIVTCLWLNCKVALAGVLIAGVIFFCSRLNTFFLLKQIQ